MGVSPDRPADWLLETLSASLSAALESLAGARLEVVARMTQAPRLAAEAAALADLLWWEQPLSLEGRPSVWMGAPDQAWREIGIHLLRASGIDDAGEADARSTYLEVLSQALSGLASAIGARLGNDVSCEDGREVLDPPGAGIEGEIAVTMEGASLPELRVILSQDLVKALEPAPKTQDLAVAATAAAGAPAPQQPQAPAQPRTLDLLMEVEMPISVSFGRAELPLKEVLKLTTGSIVELNRAVDEPVELIVNNCVIARGEVVVVEGNYGVRIKHIISPQERLRTLK
jgi:flagellar motor switch protein FliN/FliY